MSTESISQHDDVFTVYPAHLRRLMEEHNLTVPEICAALGMPSLQEWYLIQKKQDQPVRHPRIVQTARIYMRHPERLPVTKPSIRQFIQRSIALVGDEDRAKRLIESLLHKQWASIQRWLKTPGAEETLDASIRRLIDLMMEMEDEEFLATLSDGSTSYYVQVNACTVHTFYNEDTGERLYATARQPELRRDVMEILNAAPAPGRRLKDTDFVVPQGSGASYTEVITQIGVSGQSSPEDKALEKALEADKESLAWHQD